MTKQVVKIFTADQIKDLDLETVINKFLKENPDHKIILTDYCFMSDAYEARTLERALIVFEVSDSSGSGGGHKKSKPSGKKPKREPTDWSGESWTRGAYQDADAPRRPLFTHDRQRIRQ